MTFGDPIIRKSVPLALGLISASNPQLSILETLSKYSHDSDLEVAQNAIIAMGLVGAGTNNARLAQMLRQLAVYYYKEPDCFFIVRVAQVGVPGLIMALITDVCLGPGTHGQRDDRNQPLLPRWSGHVTDRSRRSPLCPCFLHQLESL